MRFMQTELVLQTKNRSEPAKNRFSVALVWAKATEFYKSISVCSTDDVIDVIRTCVRQSEIVTKTNDSLFSSKSEYFSNTL